MAGTHTDGSEPLDTNGTAEQIDDLNRHAWDLRTADTPQACALSERARALAARCDYRPGLARSLFILGHCQYRLAEYEAARAHSTEALELFAALDDHEGRADALNTIGNVYASLGDYHSALDSYLQSLALRQAIGSRQAEAASLNNIGNVHFHLADYPNARDSHQRSLAIKSAIGDRLGVGTSVHNLANVDRETGDLASALQRYAESLAIFQAIGHPYGEAGALSNMGAVAALLGDTESARDYHAQSLAIERRIGNKIGEAESLLLLGELCLHDGEPAGAAEQAQAYLQPALALAQELAANELIYRTHLALSRAYQQQGDFAAALEHHQAFSAVQRVVFDAELSEKTKKLQIIHQVEASKREAALERAEAEVVRLRNVELVAALAETERHREVAEQASRVKTELLSIAAHDLKNPLGAIIGCADLMLLQAPADWPDRDLARHIQNTTRQMLQIITDLLESTAIDSGKLRLHIQRIDLGELAARVVGRNQRQAALKGQSIHLDAEPGCLCDADETRIEEVVDNLVSNAIKYSPHGLPIWVGVQRAAAGARLVVRDQGPGLTAEDHQRMFGRFTRLSAQPTGGESATGLGLAIVKLLVNLHGGSVWAESAGPQTGSAFIVELPSG